MTKSEFLLRLSKILRINPEFIDLTKPNQLREIVSDMGRLGKVDFKTQIDLIILILEMIIVDDKKDTSIQPNE